MTPSPCSIFPPPSSYCRCNRSILAFIEHWILKLFFTCSVPWNTVSFYAWTRFIPPSFIWHYSAFMRVWFLKLLNKGNFSIRFVFFSSSLFLWRQCVHSTLRQKSSLQNQGQRWRQRLSRRILSNLEYFRDFIAQQGHPASSSEQNSQTPKNSCVTIEQLYLVLWTWSEAQKQIRVQPYQTQDLEKKRWLYWKNWSLSTTYLMRRNRKKKHLSAKFTTVWDI